MPLSLSEDTAQLVGVVSVDEAEPLAQWLRETASPKVGLKRCSTLHTAALQALLAARPEVVSPPRDPFLVTWVLPLLTDDDDAEDVDDELLVAADVVEEEALVESAQYEAGEPEPADLPGPVDLDGELDDLVGEFDDVELDDTLVIPAGLAALAEPDALSA